MKFSIIIPNWNGKKLLEKNLPKVLETGADEVIIADDGSKDGSVEFIKEKFPQIKVFSHKRLGFAKNCNRAVKRAQGDIIILLNNDVLPNKDFLNPLRFDFQDQKLFAVSFNEPQFSWAEAKWEKGFIHHNPGEKTKQKHISFWASGGSAAFRKDLWEKLGGFDNLYSPFYWEDVDLSYRAWKRGFRIIWDPQAIVNHKHEGTIGTNFSKKYIDFISQRNQLLFIWKNITDFRMFTEHKIYLWKKIIKEPGFIKPFLAALIKMPKVLIRRIKESKESKVSDKEIFSLFS